MNIDALPGQPDGENSITIRPAIALDVRQMWEIDQACFDPDIAYSMDIFYLHLLVNRDPAFVACESSGKIVGFLLTSQDKRRGGQVVTIDILPPWRRQGLGSKLIKLGEEAMRGRGAKKMALQTDVGNASAISFYGKHGYKNVKTLKNYYSHGKHAYQFEKPL